MESVFNFLLENYGAFGVILITLICLGWFMIKELRKSNESLITSQREYSESLSNSVAQSITTLTENLTNDLREQNKQLLQVIISQDAIKINNHNKEMLDRRNVTSEINNIIDDLRIQFNADRVCVLEFHNSLYNQTGFPFMKYTVTYEKITKGCTTIQQRYQGVQFSSISDVCNKILKEPNHIVTLYSRDEIDDIVPIMLCEDRQNVGGAIFKGIFNSKNNDLIGLICIEFKHTTPKKYDETSLVSSARIIGELITLVDNVKTIENDK